MQRGMTLHTAQVTESIGGAAVDRCGSLWVRWDNGCWRYLTYQDDQKPGVDHWDEREPEEYAPYIVLDAAATELLQQVTPTLGTVKS